VAPAVIFGLVVTLNFDLLISEYNQSIFVTSTPKL